MTPDEIADIAKGAIEHYLRQSDPEQRATGDRAVAMFKDLRGEMSDDMAKYRVVVRMVAEQLRRDNVAALGERR